MKQYVFITLNPICFISGLSGFPSVIHTTINFKLIPPIGTKAESKEMAMNILCTAIGEKEASRFFAVPIDGIPLLN